MECMGWKNFKQAQTTHLFQAVSLHLLGALFHVSLLLRQMRMLRLFPAETFDLAETTALLKLRELIFGALHVKATNQFATITTFPDTLASCEYNDRRRMTGHVEKASWVSFITRISDPSPARQWRGSSRWGRLNTVYRGERRGRSGERSGHGTE